MLSKAVIKRLQSLQFKKSRDEMGLFPVEGPKMVNELLQNKDWKVVELYATKNWYAKEEIDPDFTIAVSEEELSRISGLRQPNLVFAVVEMQDNQAAQMDLDSGFFLILDQIRDPGNLGTIIRIADWFGVKGIFCSLDSVDCYNPKVVQASMGSIFRLLPEYTSLLDFLRMNAERKRLPVYATQLQGDNLFTTELSKNAIVIMGNESHGVHPALLPFVTKSVLIPSKANAPDTAESLNVAIATGIICAEWLRRFQ